MFLVWFRLLLSLKIDLSYRFQEAHDRLYRMASTTAPAPIAARHTQIWEVALVAACPVALVFCLCLCIVCIVFRRQQTEPTQIQIVRPHRRSPLSQLIRQLPPPPKYEIAVTTSSPPPLYSDAEKGLIFDPLAAFAQQRRRHQQNPETHNSLSIQYLYPPKYESESQPAQCSQPPDSGSPPEYSSSSSNSSRTSSRSSSSCSIPSLEAVDEQRPDIQTAVLMAL